MNQTYDYKQEIISFLNGQKVRAREYNSANTNAWPYLVTKLSDFDDRDLVFCIFT